jgi:hypothetical protein
VKQSGGFRLIVGVCALAAAAVLVLAVAGGGGNDATLVSSSALADAATATERVPGATAAIEGKVDVEGLPKPLLIHLRGIQDERHKSAYLVGSYENFPKQAPGQSSNGTIPVEVISILPHVYMRSPLFGAALPSGKRWLHIDVAKAARKLGIGDPTQFGSSGDPSQGLQALRAVSSRVERLSPEGVRGVTTTHYHATVELRRLPAVVPPDRRAAAKKTTDRLIQLIGAESYPVDVWIDSRRLVRRMRFVMKMTVQGRSLTQEMTLELYGFGAKQKIKPPPADETVDAASLPGATP